MDVAGAISSVTAALGLVKELRDIDAQYDTAELKLKIADLTAALSDAKLGLVDVAAQIRERDSEIARLLDAIKRKETLVERRGYHYRADEEGEPIGNPLCPICLDEGHFVQTVQLYETGKPHRCPRCKAVFGMLSSYRNRE